MTGLNSGFLGLAKPVNPRVRRGQGIVLLDFQRVSNAPSVIFKFDPGDVYSHILFAIANAVPVTNGGLNMTMSIDGGGNWEVGGSSYDFANTSIRASTGAASNANSGGAASIALIGGDPVSNTFAAGGLSLNGVIYRPQNVGQHKKVSFTGGYTGTITSNSLIGFGSGVASILQGAPVNAIRLLFDSGNIFSGDFSLYGLVR